LKGKTIKFILGIFLALTLALSLVVPALAAVTTVTIDSPTGAAPVIVEAEDTVTIDFTVTTDAAGNGEIQIRVGPSGDPIDTLGPFGYTFTSGANSLSYDLDIPTGTATGSYEVFVKSRQPPGTGTWQSDTEADAVIVTDVTVTSVTPAPTLITDAQVGDNNFTVAVVFSEAMDNTVDPTITFNPTVDSTLDFASGAWSGGDTTYTATYDVADGNVKVDDIDITVQGAVNDADGLPQVAYTKDDAFNIDTENPTVESVTPDPVLITDANDGDDNFTVAVLFSEAMDATGANDPTIAFTPDVASTLTFASDAWSVSDTTYTATYDVDDGNVKVNNIHIGVTGAKDAVGNAQIADEAADAFSIDTQNPTVTSVTPDPVLITDDEVGDNNFTVAVVFSETMDDAVAPTITFDPTVDSTLDFASGAWSVSDTTYTATYDVADGNVKVDDIDIDVDVAEDANGNAQVAYTEDAAFNIDTENPTVVSVTPTPTVITDADEGDNNFTVAVVFSEAMDNTVDPTITFDPTVDSTLDFASGAWSGGDTTYTATYDVADANVTEDDIDIDVTGAEDAALGRLQAPYTATAAFDIDTENPTVTSVIPAPALITDADVGAKKFTVAVVFSEAMKNTVDPTITFEPTVATTLTYASDAWSTTTVTDDTYTATYDVADANVTEDDIDINVDGAQCANGNAQVAWDEEEAFSIDTERFPILLDAGWNLMSLPLIPNNPDSEDVLADISGDVDSVYYYDAAGGWLSYIPNESGNTLLTMEDGKAYWIDMNAAATLLVDGYELPSGGGVSMPEYPVEVGWNMVGFKSTAADMAANVYLNAMDGKYTRIYGYDAGDGAYFSLPFANLMVPGLGYWVSFTEAGIIYP
jgi:hypothetical protein